MKEVLSKLLTKKEQTRRDLVKLRNNYLISIYEGVNNGNNYREIHKKLLKDTINSKVQDKIMLKNAMKIAKKVVYSIPKPQDKEIVDKSGISILAFQLLKQLKADKVLLQNVFSHLNDENARDKENAIKETIKRNREYDNPRIFYLASEHLDSASDHKDYQGKIYVDRDWRFLIKDKETYETIRDYIKSHDIRTMQWVTGKPVWFVTRPNCRHYFKTIPTNTVLNNSVNSLIKTYNMRTKIGDRTYMQTLNHPTNKEWYQKISNAESLLNKYKERLELHKQLAEVSTNPLLKSAIDKDRLLIKKWTNYLKSVKKSI